MTDIRDNWITELAKIPKIEAGIFLPTQPGMHPICIPKAYVKLKNERMSAIKLQDLLRKQNPCILVDIWKDVIILNPQTIGSMQESIEIIKAIRAVIE